MKRLRDLALESFVVPALGALLLAGCAQQQNSSYSTEPASAHTMTTETSMAPAPAPAPAPMTSGGGFGPSYTTVDHNGMPHVKGSMSFPTGLRNHDGLLLEKTVPAEVMVGQSFSYHYNVTNLTPFPITEVVVKDRVTGNFTADSSSPQAANVSGGVATWNLGDLGPRETATISLTGKAAEEGVITTCGWATYSPILCEPIRVVKANLELVKTGPAQVTICDPIPYTITVRNTGSSVLTNVKISDEMDAGLQSSTGGAMASFDVGTLQPGQSRDVSLTATATRTGEFTNMASATSDQGVTAEDSVTTVVTAPSLSITCTTPDQRYAGRPIEVCATVSNSGNAPSENTMVEIMVPAGASFRGAGSGGSLVGNKVVWNLGTLEANGSQEVCANFVGTSIGTLNFSAMANGGCADPASSSCTTVVNGIPAVLLEVIDIEDPVEVGANETYEITVTNQGSARDTNIRIVCTLEDAQEHVSSGGVTSSSVNGKVITFDPLPVLGVGARETWRVVIKAVEAGDIRFSVQMDTDNIQRPVNETESTNQY